MIRIFSYHYCRPEFIIIASRQLRLVRAIPLLQNNRKRSRLVAVQASGLRKLLAVNRAGLSKVTIHFTSIDRQSAANCRGQSQRPLRARFTRFLQASMGIFFLVHKSMAVYRVVLHREAKTFSIIPDIREEPS